MAAEVLLSSTCVVTIWNLAADWFSVIFNVFVDECKLGYNFRATDGEDEGV
jgi:hypothetical protein